MARKRKKPSLDLEKFRRLLLAEQARLTRANRELHERTRTEMDTSDAFQDYDDVAADLAAEAQERGKNFAVERNIHDLLMKIQYALEKIEEGTYGFCDSCGAEIGERRLEVLPHAELCIECQSRLEAS
ncbi:MAG TPA: hypothetical protein EYP85_07980 [Armatimonadetes bacterium]|nr:hypothetical protein [Armatimonadota bacterium]